MDKFKGKYRISTFRAPWWNYGYDGLYFLTISTQNFYCHFGDIVNKEMQLNRIGQLVDDIIKEIPKQFNFAKIGRYVIMPNHVHLIIEIDKKNINLPEENTLIQQKKILHQASKINGGVTGIHNPMLHENIPRIIRWLKGRSTFEIRKIDKTFKWQRLYYDVIIKDQLMLKNITFYINNNPSRWEVKNKQ